MPELLGKFDSQLTEANFQKLLALVQEGMAQGEYAGGVLFDQAALAALKLKSADFSSLPLPVAGDRAYADQFNYPLALLAARFAAIASEKQRFVDDINRYLEVLQLDAQQIDRLLSASEMMFWQAGLPRLAGAQTIAYDFMTTHGVENLTINRLDPSNSQDYVDADGNSLTSTAVAFGRTSGFTGGLGAPLLAKTEFLPMRLSWTLDRPSPAPEHTETLIDAKHSWASLSILPSDPLLVYGAPTVTTVLPANSTTTAVRARGTSTIGNLPVSVKIFFTPRQQTLLKTFTSVGQQLVLSSYRLNVDDIQVFDEFRTYIAGSDFKFDVSTRTVTIVNPQMLVAEVTLLFTEFFPSYQCSLNNLDWSQTILLDQDNPFPDASVAWLPLRIKNNWFPVIDETGIPLGIEFQPAAIFDSEYLLQIQCNVTASYGAQATLEIELANPGLLNAVHLNPFTELPMRLIQISAVGLNQAFDTTGKLISTPIFTGNLALDRPMSVQVTPFFCSRLFVTLAQDNYSLEQVTIETTDQLRRQTMESMMSILPVSRGPIQDALPTIIAGAEYTFAVREVRGEYWSQSANGTTVFGPFTVAGLPQVLRLDTVSSGTITPYLIWQAYNTSGVKQSLSGAGAAFAAGSSKCFPSISSLSSASKVDFYLKFVWGSTDAVLSRLVLQVTT